VVHLLDSLPYLHVIASIANDIIPHGLHWHHVRGDAGGGWVVDEVAWYKPTSSFSRITDIAV